MPNLLSFDGSYEGFLCIIHDHYYKKITPSSIQTDLALQQALDADEYHVSTDYKKAYKVLQGIRSKISTQAENYLFHSFLSEDNDMYMDMFNYVKLGFKVGCKVDFYMQKDYVLNVHKMARYVAKEAHLLCGFSRFLETKNKVFYCEVTPINDVLPLLAEYFIDRMKYQAWVIHDTKRNKAAIYDGSKYVIDYVPKNNIYLEFSDKEEYIQDLWRSFFNAVSIKERENKSLQRNLVPLYFRKNMTEFKIPVGNNGK